MSEKSSGPNCNSKCLTIAGPSYTREDVFEDDEVFNDSSFLAKLDYSAFQKSNIFESNLNDSANKSGLNVSALCCDEEIIGYDKLTGQTWIYPTNYPVRDYQFNIIKAALLKNTLVSLPTGLGKTFIAAVIMYNFYRWYPLGKIVFAAPTRPLVAQQIDACYNIVAIPPEHTIEMTGHMQVNTRKTHWQSKRVFFATPQVIYNDIKSGICPADLIRCLVIDEAHRARRNYAYCQIVGTLEDMGIKNYRILALSATPGSKVEDVIAVIKNLHIANLELRTEECIDVAKYSHVRKINTIVVHLGAELTRLRDQYVEILDDYARRLKQLNILPQTLGNLSKGRIVMLYKEFQTKDKAHRHPQHGLIMKDFPFLIVLFHGLELLIKHGSRVFLNFFDEHPEKSWIQADDRLMALLERLRDDLGINPMSLDRSILPDGTVPEVPKNLYFGHPKFDKLKEIMLEHFTVAKRKGQDTRAIVFCEYRESVNLVHCLLLQCRPLITPQMFVGQGGSGKDGKTVVSQKQQLRVMRSFREGACNTLVATCVAEEGLDVGSVDLILCFDISTRSPIRLVQRCGRTGRERGGQVYILVTEGREHQTLLDCMRQRDGLNKRILQSRDVENSLYKMNPRMLPHDFTPQCQKMYITVKKKPDPKDMKDIQDKVKKGQRDLRGMLLSRTTLNRSSISNKDEEPLNFITFDEFQDIYPDGYKETNILTSLKEYWAMSHDELKSSTQESSLRLSTWLEWQRNLQKTVNISHSKDSEILVNLLQYSDARRFEITPSIPKPTFNNQDLLPIHKPVQSPVKLKPIHKKLKPASCKSPAKKDGDIRALFSAVTKSTKSYAKLISDLGVKDDGSLPTSLINLLVDLNLDNSNNLKKCYICQNICDCTLFKNITNNKNDVNVSLNFIKELNLPDIELIDDINVDCIRKSIKLDESVESETFTEDFNKTSNFNLEIDFDALSDLEILEDRDQNIENQTEKFNTSDNNFDIGDIEDIFVDSSPEEPLNTTVTVDEGQKDALGFFGLESIDDIFADDDETLEYKSPETKKSVINEENKNIDKQDTVLNVKCPKSPSILSGKIHNKELTSPILCSQVRRCKQNDKNKQSTSTPLNSVRKKISNSFVNVDNLVDKTKNNTETKSSSTIHNLETTNDKSMFTITQLINMINRSDSNNESKINAANPEDIIKRSPSPILLSQVERRKNAVNVNNSLKKIDSTSTLSKKTESLIILESDSDLDDTLEYDIEEPKEEVEIISNKNIKKRFSEDNQEITASPFFNKKQKVEQTDKKPLTVQEKILAAVKSNKFLSQNFNNDHTVFNVQMSPPKFTSQKENKNPHEFGNKKLNKSDEEMKPEKLNNLDILNVFKRHSKFKSPKKIFGYIINSPVKSKKPEKRKLIFEDSDDDFEDEKSFRSPKIAKSSHKSSTTTNHKTRKKKKKPNSFLDLEAELSDDNEGSGDELSDDSIGSIADFVCDDDNIAHNEDIHAHYLKSIKSPIKIRGAFKIPELPKRFDKAEVFSQCVDEEEDTYEMDSFCVDSHIGLTQVNDVSELEAAEMILERKRRKRREELCQPTQNNDSPVVRKSRHVKRQINSDSDDSS
ncbi:hypothetical protein K1T71_005704 [Dendrolimus kikuchii]|uniref:Uncharacterized protein n=1 Tax=Dendrolimus kikuchii TaxID=765133 RepID=A0ACC1D5D3_9NEOP|nr:hypothetical protein K1T71_005704 [Dendrolimus kikuchii]